LWRAARPLAGEPLPAWLRAKDAHLYRWLEVSPAVSEPREEGTRAATEIAELAAAGVIVPRDPIDPRVRRCYVRRREDDIWSIGLYGGDSPLDLVPLGDGHPILTGADVTDAPATGVADPFLLRVESGWFMFFEVVTWPLSRGEIAHARSVDGLQWTYGGIVLRERFHLSYPQVFEWDGAYYMVPESAHTGAVRLYRASRFPTEWSVVTTLLRGPRLADPSIVRYGNRWWLFVETSPTGRHDRLSLYHAEALTGPWVEHPCSPIVSGDPRIARPAGRVLVRDGVVIRFAQNCGPGYGTEVRAFAVTELTPTGYAEREVRERPILAAGTAAWNAGGMHHVDAHRLHDGRWIAAVDGRAAATQEPT
jgi:hypothetical protein